VETLAQILREYETAFRDLVTQKNWSSNQRVKETLRLNKDQDWSFICTALDVIGDTTPVNINTLWSILMYEMWKEKWITN